MREQLIQYVNLLFAGAPDCDEMKQEILQNTLDRYDDLIAEGKVPAAAYRLAIAGIGDLGEILGTTPQQAPVYTRAPKPRGDGDTDKKKWMRAIAVALYILCPTPLFVLCQFAGLEIIGLCGLLAIVAVATLLIILGAKKEPEEEFHVPQTMTPEMELRGSIDKLVTTVGVIAYFAISFTTRQWHITWLVFPIIGAVKGLIHAVLDYKETVKHEN